MNHLDFAVTGIHGLAVHYSALPIDLDPQALAVEVATTLAQPVLCMDCETYVPLSTIVSLGIKCPGDERKMYGHRAMNDAITSILDTRENLLRTTYPAKPAVVETEVTDRLAARALRNIAMGHHSYGEGLATAWEMVTGHDDSTGMEAAAARHNARQDA